MQTCFECCHKAHALAVWGGQQPRLGVAGGGGGPSKTTKRKPKTKAKPKREGTETIQGVVVSYKKPYFTVLYDDGDEDDEDHTFKTITEKPFEEDQVTTV